MSRLHRGMKEWSVPPISGRSMCAAGCQLFWFDAGECERTPPADPRIEEDKERRRLIRDRADTLRTIDVPQPNWQLAFCLFGMPLETTASRLRRYPLVTWWTCRIVAALALLSFIDLRHMVDLFSFVPARPWRRGITLVTSFALHADGWHLIGNLCYLLVFGDNVETLSGGDLSPRSCCSRLLLERPHARSWTLPRRCRVSARAAETPGCSHSTR